ncbi:MAG TPA: nitroreductase/quinone reductase family protein [Candidatus Binatia bacterium]
MNGVIVAILRSPLRGLLDAQLMLVTVTGRRSGKRYTIPVGYQRDGNSITVLVSRAQTKKWWRNYREPGPVEVYTRGRSHDGTARVIAPESPEFAAAFETTFRQLPWLGPQFGIQYARASGLTGAQRDILANEGAVVRIDLEAPGARTKDPAVGGTGNR